MVSTERTDFVSYPAQSKFHILDAGVTRGIECWIYSTQLQITEHIEPVIHRNHDDIATGRKVGPS